MLELTTREREVAWLAAEMSTREIGERLGIAETTAKYHLDRARMKLGVRNKRELPAALREASIDSPFAADAA